MSIIAWARCLATLKPLCSRTAGCPVGILAISDIKFLLGTVIMIPLTRLLFDEISPILPRTHCQYQIAQGIIFLLCSVARQIPGMTCSFHYITSSDISHPKI